MSIDATKPVRCVVIGAGVFGRLHALTLLKLAEAQLVGMVDRSAEALAHLPDSLASVKRWMDMHQALHECDAPLWIVATPTPSHRMLVETLLTHDKTVLVEKPLAMDVAEASRLAPLVRADSSNLMVGHVALFGAEFRQIVKESRQRGPIAFIEAVRHRPTSMLERYPDDTPLNLLMVHDLYMADVLMQGAEPRHMQARCHRTGQGGVDLVVAQIQWPGGTVGLFTASFMTPAGMAADGFDRLEVFGQGWAARTHDNPRPLTVWSDRAEWPLGLDILADGTHASGVLAEELRHCCRVARGLEPVTAGVRFHDALRMQHWLERMAQSAAESF